MASPKLDLTVRGNTGLPVWGGRVYDEYLLDLQGERGRRILREMSEQDPIIGGILLGVEMLSRQVTWTINAANVEDDKKDKAQEVADFVDGALTDMSPSWEDTLSEILSMLIYGWSWMEILYKKRGGLSPDDPLKNSHYDDGKIGWRGWAIRSQETLWSWEYEHPDGRGSNGMGELMGMNQMAPPAYNVNLIPRSKSLHFRTRSRRENPEGISLLRNCYRPWYMKKNIEAIEGIGIERDLAGLPVLWAPHELFSNEASDEEKSLLENLRKIVTSIKRDEQEGVLMPMAYDEDGKNPLYKLELLSTGGDRQFDTNAIIGRYDERIAMSMLADFILMGHQAVGSYALSTSKTGLFSTALSAILDLIAAEVNRSAIVTLVRLNGYDLDLVPTLSHGKIETADLSKLGAYLQQLSAAGMAIFPNKPLEEYLLDTAGLPVDPDAMDEAGSMPFPDVDANGNPLPVGPDGTPVPVAGPGAVVPGAKVAPAPASAQIRPSGQRRPNRLPPARTTPPRKAAVPNGQQPRAAAERPRFVPLVQRVAKISEELEHSLGDDYKNMLAAVMAAGRFSSLSQAYQEAILLAER